MEKNTANKRSAVEEIPVVAKKSFNFYHSSPMTNFVQEISANAGVSETPKAVPYYKQVLFYKSCDTHKLSNVEVRKYWCPKSGPFHIHWCKDNGARNGQKLSSSHQQISASGLPQFIEKLKGILNEIGKTSYKTELPRFMGNQYAQITDRNNVDFWHPSLVEKLSSSDLVIRPFKNYRGCWSVRILHPMSSEAAPNWTGIMCDFDVNACKQFVGVLETIEKEIDKENDRLNFDK